MEKTNRTLVLALILFQTACATTAPGRGARTGLPSRTLTPPPVEQVSPTGEPGFAPVSVHDVLFIEPEHGTSRPIPIDRAGFQRALQRLASSIALDTPPREAARALLQAGLEEEWVAEVYRDRVLTLAPLGPDATLTPEADAALRDTYLRWCEGRGGGDCLELLDDGPYLRTDDRRTLALALAFGSVLDETREALAHELHPRALVSLAVWTVGLYCMAWMVPEPTLKAVAATLTVILVGWLGVETVWRLMDGWAQLATQAHEATTFEELRAAGEQYGKVLGRDSARAMILAVGAVAGRTLGEVAARVRTLPGSAQAGAQWNAQGGAAVLESVGTMAAQEGALAAAVVAVETVAASPQGPLAAVMLRKGAGGGSASGGRPSTTVIRHRGGNQQVELANGHRWHLPRGKSLRDIPREDKAGDQLQEAVSQAAREWGPEKLSLAERAAIEKAVKRGKYWLARLLEREARGRYVHEEVKKQLQRFFTFKHQGVDVVDPATGLKYEILSGTESNLARHGRRMAGEFFRMLTF